MPVHAWLVRLTRENTHSRITKVVLAGDDVEAVVNFLKEFGATNETFEHWVLEVRPCSLVLYDVYLNMKDVHVPRFDS